MIVNVSSAAARGIHRIPYSAAKGGVNALTASLAWEYAEHGIRVVATAPGGIEAPPRRVSRGTPEAQTEQEKAWFQAHVDQTLTVLADAPLRDAGRGGRAHPLPRLRRGVLHHRDAPAGGGR